MKWIEIKGNEDIKKLLEIFGNLHDSCLKELLMWTDSFVDKDLSMGVGLGLDTNIRMLFQRQSINPSAIELLFEGVTQLHLSPSPENYDSIILDAILLLQDGTFYWADAYDWKPISHDDEVTWIASKRVKWRDVSNWMGDNRRYGVLNEG
ncbi:hypothetical protein [Peribacillus kribbensis]|uniref:hypothetical protein n=1 Tax=Peribacillus kribbensis TaxID=356658 RepID=UPI00047A54BB|nr:hypothetical protein [Peribacillus kribbensis]